MKGQKCLLRIVSAVMISAAVLGGTAVGGSVGTVYAAVQGTAVSSTQKTVELQNLSSVSADSITLGGNIIMNGAASGGNGSYTYAYFYKKASDTNWITKKNFSTTSSVSIHPLKAATYNICIKVKDSKGSIAKKYFDVTVKSALVNNSSVSALSINQGQSVTVSGAAGGGSGEYTYAYYYKKSSDTAWTTKSNFSTVKSVTIKPALATTYNICVKVKDSNGAVTKKYFDVAVKSVLVNNSSVSSSSIIKGQSVTLKGAADGGSGEYTYAYYYKKYYDASWTTKSGFSTQTSVSITPAAATTYNICIKVKDSNGAVVNKYFDVAVNLSQPLANQSSISKTTITLGESVTLNGSAGGGNSGYTYAYLYQKSSDTKWTTLTNFSTKQSVLFAPDSAGTYSICIKVKDSSGTIAEKTFALIVKDKIIMQMSYPLVNNSSISQSKISAGASITLKASANGGSGNYMYSYLYKSTSSSKWTVISDFTSASEKQVYFDKEGTYDICVRIKDSNGTISDKYFTLTVESQNVDKMISDIVKSIITPSMSDLEKVKAIHDWIVYNIDYDIKTYYYHINTPTSSTIEGALTTKLAICDGYAKTFLAMAKTAGLEANYVSGQGLSDLTGIFESHAWNQVKVNGSWYNIDVTWDDPIGGDTRNGKNMSYLYFLVPDSSFRTKHSPQSAVYSCTTAQPAEKIARLTADTNPNVYYCSTDPEWNDAFKYYISQGVKEFKVIYKTTENNTDKIFDTIWKYTPYSVQKLTCNFNVWKINGYYEIDVIMSYW